MLRTSGAFDHIHSIQQASWSEADSNHRSPSRGFAVIFGEKKGPQVISVVWKDFAFRGGPVVRIRFAPEASQQRTRFGHCQIEAFWSEYVGADHRQAALGAVIA